MNIIMVTTRFMNIVLFLKNIDTSKNIVSIDSNFLLPTPAISILSIVKTEI